MIKKVLTVGLCYTGDPIHGVEFENLGLCSATVEHDRAAYPLYEYDVIVINPESFSHFFFGARSDFSESINELGELKRHNPAYDIDSAFDPVERQNEMSTAISAGTTVIWCLSEAKRMNFFGYRDTWLGYAAPPVARMVRRGGLLVKKGRRIGRVDPESPFVRYFESLASSGWKLCLSDNDIEGYTSLASTPEGYSLGGQVSAEGFAGWLVSPPTSKVAANCLILDALRIEKGSVPQEKYHGIFLSHTSADKPFVRQLRNDLLTHGVPRVWVDEAEIEIGDSLTEKIAQGMKEARYIGVVLSSKSIEAPWVKKELEIAINREISVGEVVVLPLLYEDCTLPTFLEGKLYADFTSPTQYESSLAKLLRKLRIR